MTHVDTARPGPLSSIDSTLWEIERDPQLRTTIVATIHLDRPVDEDRFRNDLEATTRMLGRLRQRVVALPGGLGTPRWEIVDDFRLEDHLSIVSSSVLQRPATVQRITEELASAAFDRDRPLWECVYVTGAIGPTTILIKVHHSLTDGVGGVALLESMLDQSPDAPARDLADTPIPSADLNPGVVDRLVASSERGASIAGSALWDGLRSLRHPLRTGAAVVDGVGSALRTLSPGEKAGSDLMGARSSERLARNCTVDLEQMHSVAAGHGCTMTHAMFAGVIEGIARYHAAREAPLENLRVVMPVSFRDDDDASGGNKWAPVRFRVPVDVADPVERMLAMRGIVNRSRRESSVGFSPSLAAGIQLLPSRLSSAVVGSMMKGVDTVITSVPGITEPRFVAGARVERIFAYAPTAGAAVNASLVSVDDVGCIGLLLDAGAIDAPDELRDDVAGALDELLNQRRTPPTAVTEAPLEPEPRPLSPRRLSAVDTSFLRMETEETPMHLGGVLTLEAGPLRRADGAIDIDRITRHIEARMARVPRFTQRLAEVPLRLGRPLWVDDPAFDSRRHVHLLAAPAPGGRAELLEIAATLHETRLDRRHPLWELWIIDGLANDTVGVVEKVHHALIDGVSGVELLGVVVHGDEHGFSL